MMEEGGVGETKWVGKVVSGLTTPAGGRKKLGDWAGSVWMRMIPIRSQASLLLFHFLN